MAAKAEDVTRIVFRLRGIPAQANTFDDARRLLVSCFSELVLADVDIQSLASSLDYWEQPPSKVATLRLKKFPAESLQWSREVKSWDLSDLGERGNKLILDHDFLGLTPLNDVDTSEHIADCIALSGLASHPFGSWQPHGLQKSFMWIRDEAPLLCPGVRMILYGHDSGLIHSNSFQLISDIARDFIQHMRIGGWSFSSAKPLLFLAHSLGGLVLKDAFVQMTDAKNDLDVGIVKKVRGAIFFGVPNLGMEQTHLQTMVQGQPNETLVQDLSRNSNYLLRLDESFSGTAYLSKLTLFWAYETLQSHTIIRSRDGHGWDRKGPLAILVSQYSATCRQQNPSTIFPVQRNHSDMVKFDRGQHYTKIVCLKILDITRADASNLPEESVHNIPANRAAASGPQENEAMPIHEIDSDFILASLDAPDLNLRLDSIDENFETTFEWVFEHDEFVTWLSKGNGVFWINGKPGSGKSTLMKFLFQHQKTEDYLFDWMLELQYNLVGFFFHYRGTLIQKSFEGLLRSLLRQIVQQQPELCEYLQPFFINTKSSTRKHWSLSELAKALRDVLTQKEHCIRLCLFLDALDEFYGNPDMICRFLMDLVEMQDGSRFSLKLCFSSRPWDVFEKAFGRFSKLSLQDYTKTDIQDYCLGMIEEAEAPTEYLEILVPDIVQRASGVFLWVSLVVKDLSNAMMNPQRASKSLEELRTILDTIPLELDGYYRRIIERMPNTYRWETFALLEAVIRAKQSADTRLDQVVEAVSVSRCTTHAEAAQIIKSLRRRDPDSIFAQNSRMLRLWGGGLVEVYHARVQLMHQTVFEFVNSLEFKEVVLGKLAKITHDNGHVFHMKAFLAQPSGRIPHQFHMAAHHARKSEATTGLAQVGFIKSLPQELLDEVVGPLWVPSTILNFVFRAELKLFLRDVGREGLATMLFHPINGHHVPKDLIKASCKRISYLDQKDFAFFVRVLLGLGYNHHEIDALTVMMRNILRLRFEDYESIAIDTYLSLIDSGWPLTYRMRWHDTARKPSRISPLHVAPPRLAKGLIDRGSDPNSLCSLGYTPLDTCLDFDRGYELNRLEDLGLPESTDGLEYVFQLASVLVQSGGKLRQTTMATCLVTLGHFERLPQRHQALEKMLESISWIVEETDDEEDTVGETSEEESSGMSGIDLSSEEE
jgi:hypothetical protein